MLNQNIKLAVDDFGAGHSTSVLLTTGSPSFIKTDMSLLRMEDRKTSTIFLKETVHLASLINSQVIAEGVESPHDEEHIIRCGIKYAQGYHYSPAIPFALFSYQFSPWEENIREEELEA